jgi:hypothetical protein
VRALADSGLSDILWCGEFGEWLHLKEIGLEED